jgi:hypothetical protein
MHSLNTLDNSFIDTDGKRRKYISGVLHVWSGSQFTRDSDPRIVLRDSNANDGNGGHYTAKRAYLDALQRHNQAELQRKGVDPVEASMASVITDPNALEGAAAASKTAAQNLVAELARRNREALK